GAEDIAEHEHEDHRLDRGEHQQLRNSPVADQVAAGDLEGVPEDAERDPVVTRVLRGHGDRDRAHRRAPFSSAVAESCGSEPAAPSRAAWWPVSARNTASMLGSRTGKLSGSRSSPSHPPT